MDWDNARVFLAICRRGTLRGAAARTADRSGHCRPAADAQAPL